MLVRLILVGSNCPTGQVPSIHPSSSHCLSHQSVGFFMNSNCRYQISIAIVFFSLIGLVLVRKTRDINQIKCIKDVTDRLLVKDEEIMDRWREYFDKLFNGESEGATLELDDSFDDTNRRCRGSRRRATAGRRSAPV